MHTTQHRTYCGLWLRLQSWLMLQSPHRLWNDLKCVEWDVKLCSVQSNPIHVSRASPGIRRDLAWRCLAGRFAHVTSWIHRASSDTDLSSAEAYNLTMDWLEWRAFATAQKLMDEWIGRGIGSGLDKQEWRRSVAQWKCAKSGSSSRCNLYNLY